MDLLAWIRTSSRRRRRRVDEKEKVDVDGDGCVGDDGGVSDGVGDGGRGGDDFETYLQGQLASCAISNFPNIFL